jgi:hypothetical protein
VLIAEEKRNSLLFFQKIIALPTGIGLLQNSESGAAEKGVISASLIPGWRQVVGCGENPEG